MGKKVGVVRGGLNSEARPQDVTTRGKDQTGRTGKKGEGDGEKGREGIHSPHPSCFFFCSRFTCSSQVLLPLL